MNVTLPKGKSNMELEDFSNSSVVSEHLVLDKVQLQQQHHQEKPQQQVIHIHEDEIYQPALVSEADSNYSEPKYYLGKDF